MLDVGDLNFVLHSKQIASAFPLATGLKELFSIGLWGEGINVNQS